MKTLIGLIAGAALAVVWVISAIANYIFASTYVGAEYSNVFGWSSVAIDVSKLIASGVFVWLVTAKKEYRSAAAAGVVWFVCAAWSSFCLHGFVSLELLSSTQVRKDDNTRAEREFANLQKRYNAELITLQSFKTRKRSKDDIENQEKAVADLEKRIAEAPTSDRAVDPLGASFQSNYGISESFVQKFTLLGFLVVLEVLINLGYAAFHRLWLKEADPSAPAAPAPAVAPPAPIPQQVAAPAPVTMPAPSAPVLVVDNSSRHRVGVEDFVNGILKQYAGERIHTRVLQESYGNWCDEHKIEQLGANQLGHALSRFDIRRTANKDGQGRYFYMIPAAA
jgi:hypothetical protein